MSIITTLPSAEKGETVGRNGRASNPEVKGMMFEMGTKVMEREWDLIVANVMLLVWLWVRFKSCVTV